MISDDEQIYVFPGNNALGLTKREYFAAMALQGLLSANDNKMTFEAKVEASVMYADYLINELNIEV